MHHRWELPLAHSACNQATSNIWRRRQKLLVASRVPVIKTRGYSLRCLSHTFGQRLRESAPWYWWQPGVRTRRSRTGSSEEFRECSEFQVIQATVSTLRCWRMERPVLRPHHWHTWCLPRNSWLLLPLLRSRWSGDSQVSWRHGYKSWRSWHLGVLSC